MSRRDKQQQLPAGSRRTRRAAELPRPRPRPPAGLAESGPHQIVSNPIFRYEAGPSQPRRVRPPGEGDHQHLRCVYGPGSLYALVHDPAASASTASGIGKSLPLPLLLPLPLPPCRAHPLARVGPAHAVRVGGPHGRVLRRAPHDPFLAAYVACSKSKSKSKDAASEVVDRSQQGRKKKKKEKATATVTGKKNCKEEGEVFFRGCGIWSGWAAAGGKYAGAMSCRHGCAVAGQKGDDAHATATKSEDDAPAGAATPKLDLSWTPAVLSARALERREHR